jgi:putative nucleotidyltransferase with HDIG domain
VTWTFWTARGRLLLALLLSGTLVYRRHMTAMIDWARTLAGSRLAVALPRRWKHVQAVADRAERLRPVAGVDADLLVAGAWLHDVGYAEELADLGFHPLDGARHLRALGADSRLCGLVANHSGAMCEAGLRELSDALSEFPDEDSFVRDALWYCDMTTSPVGEPVTFDERLTEIRARYGADHVVPRGITAAEREIRSAIQRVAARAREMDVLLG